MTSSSGSDKEASPPQQFTRQSRFAFGSNIKIIPEGGWGWAICAAAFVAQLIVMGIHNSFGILYTTLLEEYQKSKAETGMLDLLLNILLAVLSEKNKFTSIFGGIFSLIQ